MIPFVPIIHARSLEEFSKYDNAYDHLLSSATVKRYREALGMLGDYLNECQVQDYEPSLGEVIEAFNQVVNSIGDSNEREENSDYSGS